MRITSRCSTQDEFVAVYRQYCDERSIFIATKTPKPRGTTLRFAVTLADGEPQIVGVGRIAESHPNDDNPYKRPGMRIEFIDLEDSSRKLVHRLHSARRLAAAPPPLPPGVVKAIPIAPGAPPPPPEQDPHLGEGSDTAAVPGFSAEEQPTDVKEAPGGANRAAGSEFILPANPFGEVPDESLEGFVECTLYEEDGAIVLPPEEEVERQLKWLAPGALGTPLPTQLNSAGDPVDPVHAVDAAFDRARPPRRTTPTPVEIDDEEAALDRLLRARPRRTTTTIAPPMPVDERAQWKLLGIACGSTAVVALLLGYFIWGGAPGTLVVNNTTAPLPEQPASTATAETPAPASAPSGETDPAAGTDSTTAADLAAADSPETAPEPAADRAAAGASEDETDDSDPDPPVATTSPETTEAKPALNTGAPSGECNATIRTTPEGATVHLDGTLLGDTPLVTGVPCGSGLLKIVRPRYESIEKRVEMGNGTTELDLKMNRPIHSLTVTSFPAGANASVNGRSIGRTPAKTTVKGYERARIKLTKRGYETVSKRVYMRRSAARVHTKLKRQGSSSNKRLRTSKRR